MGSEEYDCDVIPSERWNQIPVPPTKKSIKAIDMTNYIFDIQDPTDETTQLIFPNVPRNEERVEVQWIWIFGKPKYGKTTKCRAMLNYALNSGRYNLDKMQIMEGEDLATMMDGIKRGTEVCILLINDAHKYQSTFAMASHEGREHADITFLARHIFKNRTGLPYGILIIIANAQELKSINKWIRDQAVIIGYCGNIPGDENIKHMPPALKGKLAKITTYVEEYKRQDFKSEMVVIIQHRLQGDLSIAEHNDINKTPYGFVHLNPLKRACYSCKTFFNKFYLKCPACGSHEVKEVIEYAPLDDEGNPVLTKDGKPKKNFYPYNEIVHQVEGRDIAKVTIEQLAQREELVDTLYERCISEGIKINSSEFFNRLVYEAQTHWLSDMSERKMFEKEGKHIYRSIRGKFAAEKGIALNDDDDVVEEEIDLSAPTQSVVTRRYQPDILEIVNRLEREGKIKNSQTAEIFKLYHFDKNGKFVTDSNNRQFERDELAQKFNVKKNWITNIVTATNKKGNIWQKIFYILGHEYESWVAKQLQFHNCMPLLHYDNNQSRMIFLCGGVGEPDVIVAGMRNGKQVVDIISLKATVFDSSKMFYLDYHYPDKCDIMPEVKAYLDLTGKGVTTVTVMENGERQPKKLKCSKDHQINIVMLMRNTYHPDVELVYVWDKLDKIPSSMTFSKEQYEKATHNQVAWQPI